MESIRIISTNKVQAPTQNAHSTTTKIHLTPWDLHFLTVESIQKGLLFHNNKTEQNISTQIQNLKNSFSTTLSFFPPLTGSLSLTKHDDDTKTASCSILCNNVGALFVHAVADNTRVSDILKPNYVPKIVHSFFPLNGVMNHQGTSQPLLAVQITELIDGIFIGCTINHVVADGGSFWHFMNSWAEISRGYEKPSKLPFLEHCFLDGIEPPIMFPFTKEDFEMPNPQVPPPERYFHFTKEKVLQLKAKANTEVGIDKKISSLQAVLSHLWRSVIRCKRVDPEIEVSFALLVGIRPRMIPQLPEDYFGNAAMIGIVTMKAGDLEEGGVGNVAWEMNKMISSHSNQKIRSQYESWVKTPSLLELGTLASSYSLGISSSPRFNVYGNDFGWGKPLAVRSGCGNKRHGKISVFAGAEEGSIDLEVCLPYEILESLGNDPEFMDAASV